MHPLNRLFPFQRFLIVLALLTSASGLQAEQKPVGYRLGPGDVVSLRVSEEERVSRPRVRVEDDGTLFVELIGRLNAAGTSPRELEKLIADRLREFVQEPHVSIGVVEYGSRPVSVLGEVRSPGTHQLAGNKNLVEVLSAAGGVREEAGYTVTVTRRLEWGSIPVDSAVDDEAGGHSVVKLDLHAVIEGGAPAHNIAIMPHDVISVPRAHLVYVIGAVERSGGFALREREQISVIEALALAGGLDRIAALRKAKILRAVDGQGERQEVIVDLKAILADNAPDLTLQQEDILFIPTSGGKRAGVMATAALVNFGTGAAIWRAARP